MAFLPSNINAFIGRRISEARKEASLSQQELSDELGFKTRQILSNIEKGLRKAKNEELAIIGSCLNKPLGYFRDFYALPNKQLFSWRAIPNDDGEVEYETKGRRLISSFKELSDLVGDTPLPTMLQLAVEQETTYDEIDCIAENFVNMYEMGDAPSKKIQEIIEKLNIQLFFIDPEDEVAGAAYHEAKLSAIFINMKQSIGRQRFSMAHELFHVLTWYTFHPEHFSPIEHHAATTRSEKLANKFASSLLMPKGRLNQLWKERNEEDLQNWINHTAKELEVSTTALFWRLVSMRKLKKDDELLSGLEKRYSFEGEEAIFPFNKKYIQMLRNAIDSEYITLGRALEILDCNEEFLVGLFSSYKLQNI